MHNIREFNKHLANQTTGKMWIYLLISTLFVNVSWCYDLLPSPTQSAFVNKHKLQNQIKIDDKEISRSISFSASAIANLQRLEQNILNAQIASHHKIVISNAQENAKQIAKNALILDKATIQLISRFCYKNKLSSAKCSNIISQFNATNASNDLNKLCSNLSASCTPEQVNYSYRSMDGSCNHKYSQSIGQSLTAYKRLVYAAYIDGVHSPRRSVNKKFVLPSARDISNRIIQREDDKEMTAGPNTLAFAHWGEFIEHDMLQTVPQKMVHFDSSINCCSPEGNKLAPRYMHPFCSPIDVAKDDEFYSKKDIKCLSYVRSMGGLRDDCSFGPLDQLNQATHYLDASHIYGGNEEKSKYLRNGIRGQMRSNNNYLPKIEKSILTLEMPCHEEETCYDTGDARANTHPQLAILHTIFLREHNRIAQKLSQLNPLWNDETLYQEARKIVIAEIQHITYDEWLPFLIPESDIKKIMEIKEYQEVTDPAISNSFATAAIRFIKNLIPQNIQLINEDRTINASINLGDHIYKPLIVEELKTIGPYIRGLATQKTRKLDLKYTKDLLDLYGDKMIGLDVISLDIQRGRDHGLPGYNSYRKLCGLAEAKVFDDLLDTIPIETVKTLSKIYLHPNDVDLIIGGISEVPLKDSLLGKTFTCLITEQFKRTRAGDRFFYSFSKQKSSFTDNQQKELQKVTLAKIMCNNGDDVERIQSNVFLPISSINKLTKCHELPDIDLSHWRS